MKTYFRYYGRVEIQAGDKYLGFFMEDENAMLESAREIITQANWVLEQKGRTGITEALEMAYSYMLQTPISKLRAENQLAFCEVRDMIAYLRGLEPHEVQEEFETVAPDNPQARIERLENTLLSLIPAFVTPNLSEDDKQYYREMILETV